MHHPESSFMWNNYWSGRSRRDVPQVNYRDPSSDEDDFNSPLVSPTRPPPTRAGSPALLAVPTLGDNVDEELEAVSRTLTNVGHTHTFRGTRPQLRPDPEGRELGEEAEEEVVNEGVVIGEADDVGTVVEQPDRPAMVNFEDEDGVDSPRALQDACQNLSKLEWSDTEVRYFFKQAETRMAAVGVKKNYTKFQAISMILPKKVSEEVKHMLVMDEDEFPEKNAYKQLKQEVLRIFGPRPDEAIERALSRVLVGPPSHLARALVNDICKKRLKDCECCPPIVLALWKRNLSSTVKAGIAHCQFNYDTFNATVQLADDIHSTTRPGGAAKAVAAVSLDETQPAIPYATGEVAAVSRGGGGRGGRGGARGGRGGRGNRGGNRGGGQSNQNQNQNRQSGTRHPDLPSGDVSSYCSMHFRWGKNAFFCADPGNCPWKNVFAPKPPKQNNN